MDCRLPVARRTRLQIDEDLRKKLEKRKEDEKRKASNGNVTEEGTSKKRHDLDCSSSRRFFFEKEKRGSEVKNCSIAGSNLEKGRKQNDVCFSVGRENMEGGSEDNPFYIDGDGDNGDVIVDDDDGGDEEEEEEEEEEDGEGDDDDDDDEDWKPFSGDGDGNSDKSRGTEKHKKAKGSGFKVSDDESEGDGFRIISEAEYEKSQLVHGKSEGENDRDKTNEGSSVEEEVDMAVSSDFNEDQKMGNHLKRRERSDFGRSEDGDNAQSDSDGYEILRTYDEERDDHDGNRQEICEKKMERKNGKEITSSSTTEIEISSSTSDEEERIEVEEDKINPKQNYSVSFADNATYVAQRTRTRSGKLKKKETKSASSRHHVGEDVEGECVEICESGEEEELERFATRKRKCEEARGNKRKELIMRSTKKKLCTKRKLKCGEHGYDIFQILVNSICEKGEVQIEDLVSNADKRTPADIGDQPVLPLKFTFGVEEPIPPEKSEYDMEMDELWAEMDLAQTYDGIGSSASNMDENEDSVPLERCGQGPEGKHNSKLEEEIGLICSYCGKVLLEINCIVPFFEKNTGGRSDFRELYTSDCSFFDDLGYQDSDCESHSSSGFSARVETVWDIIPGVKDSMYPHQREGFEFIWKHIAGGIYRENFENIENYSSENGCIISHAPGTGKSRLTIVFIQTYMKLHPKCLPLIIAPSSMLLTWEEEFRKWKVDFPFHNLNIDYLSGKEDEMVLRLLRHFGREDIDAIRLAKLCSWKKGGSILAVSYTLFEKLVTVQNNDNAGDFREILLRLPNLMVLDEGHRPRNNQSLIWQALSKVQTRNRILLSGTPFQNNFIELYNTMCMVQPKFLETCNIKCGRKGKERKEWADLTKSIGKSDDAQMVRLKHIKSIIDPLVHIHRGDILEKSLPGLRESIVLLKPFELQSSLLQDIEEEIKQQFTFQYAVALTSVHPSLLLESKVEIDCVKSYELRRLRSNPDAGVKTKFLIELIRLSTAMNERVLVFSEYLNSLSLIMEYLKSRFGWTEKEEILYIDGARDMKERQNSINKLNDPSSNARVVLASIKACGEGINLVGASRVVLLDVVWNPSLERQATRRAYRLGQKRVVYVYHLIASGTMEEDKYSRQAEKDRLSKLVFSSSDSIENKQKIPPRVTEDKILELMVQHENLKPMFERISFKEKENRPMGSSDFDLSRVSSSVCEDFL